MTKITLIKPDGCAHCVEVKKTIEKLKIDYPEIALEEIDMISPGRNGVGPKTSYLVQSGNPW